MRDKILIVDDEEINREILEEMLKDEYAVLMAKDGDEALLKLSEFEKEIAAVLLDLIMPGRDGYEVLQVMKEKSWLDKIPVLIITSENTVAIENKCFEMGVSDFIGKPFSHVLVKKRVDNIVNLFSWKNDLEDTVEKQTETLRKQYRILKLQAEKLQESNDKIINILGMVVEHRNMEGEEHVTHIKEYTKILTRQLRKLYPEYGITDTEEEIIVGVSALHDVGKIAIPDSILLKTGKLTREEREYTKSHTIRGCEVLEHLKGIWDENYQRISYEICRYHHERYDGRGYPDKLVGEAIPISAQIVSIADVYDALVTDSVYKRAYSKEEAFHMIITGECGIFSPKLMECFRQGRGEFEKVAGKS